uniref:Odorant receptor n=1 Tax=Scaeva pyrastri TaxID=219539 RepID=A0A1B3B7A5_SCAPY|nr:putative odorant receptor OR25 [Scaeva pyrastri]
MLFENIPILSINVKIWKFWSVILSHTWRRYIFVGPIAIMNVLQFVFLYQKWGEVDTFILNAFYAMAIFNSLLRTVMVIFNRARFEKFMTELAALYVDIEESNNQSAIETLKKATEESRKISTFNLTASFFDLIGALLYPVFSKTKVHPFGVAIPGIDVTLFPFYEIIYFMQLSFPVILTSMYMPFVSLFVSFAMFGTAALKNIQMQLRNLYSLNQSEEQMYHDLIACISYHARIMRFVEDLNSLVTYILFAEFMIYSVILCALLFCLNIIESVMQKIAVVMYIMTMLYVLFTYYWQANELLTESIKVSVAAYDVEWFHCSGRFKKTLLCFIMRTQKPLVIMLGNVYPMSLETFQSLLNASYSYFTLLREAYK